MTARSTASGLVRLRPLLIAVALLASVSGSLLAPPAALAATPDLTLVTTARYVVDVANARIAVGVDIVATDHKADTRSYRYYFTDAYLAVLPNASGFTLSATGAKPSVSVARRTAGYTLLHLVFGTHVDVAHPLRLHLAFDLKDRGGSPTRDVRVGQALVQFPVWAFATDSTAGSSVSVVVPAGYTIGLSAGQLKGPTPGTGGTQVLSSGPLAQPLAFFAYVTADRPGAYATSTVSVTVDGRPASVDVEAWPDDAAWSTRVGDVFRRGLPAIGDAVGLPYPLADQLVVRESVSRTLGGYAGIFDPAAGRIDVDYAASPFVMLHEASHVWFNGSLLADRWANEAFATYYGMQAAKALKVAGAPDPLTPELQKSTIPLNAWGAVGETPAATESYAYAASAVLATEIADRAGAVGMQKVWAAASDRDSAYQPASGPVEHLDGPPDWRAFLDLLEQLTGRRYDDLWTTYVVRPTDTALLSQRASARSDYTALLGRVDGWAVPAAIREAMTAWRFDTAEGLIAQAGQVLDERASIAAAVAPAGLTAPTTLRRAFESGQFGPARTESEAELRTISVVRAAIGARPPSGDLIVALGLVGSSPETDVAAARTAFAAGDLTMAASRAMAARAAFDGAHDAGLRRALSLGIAALLLLAMLTVLAVGIRGRRRSRRLPGRGGDMAHPYATLAAGPASVARPEGRGGEGSGST